MRGMNEKEYEKEGQRVGEKKAEVKSESLCFIPRMTVEVLNVRPM